MDATKMWRQRLGIACAAMMTGLGAWSGGCDRPGGGGDEKSGGKAAAPAAVPLDLSGAVVIGASVSAGAEVVLPGLKPKMIEGDASLADALGAITSKGGGSPKGFGDLMFFLKPDATAERQLAATIERKPTMVFAVDYLFWHAYGAPMSDDARRKAFNRGLERLDKLTCPIVVADLPDMTHAVGLMLQASQVPSKAVQDELNKKLEAWAATRPRVVLIKLRQTVAAMMANQAVRIGGKDLAASESRAMLTTNGLHTTADGCILLGLECLIRLKEKGLLPAGAAWDEDPASVKTRLTETMLAVEKAKAAAGKP